MGWRKRSACLLLLFLCLMTACEGPDATGMSGQSDAAQNTSEQNAEEQDSTGNGSAEQPLTAQRIGEADYAERKAEGQQETSAETDAAAPDTEACAILLRDLVLASEAPSQEAFLQIDADLLGTQDALARGIAETWKRYFLDPEYRMLLYGRDDVSQLAVEDENAHAFVVLGYELKGGKMSPELKGRCDAAALAAEAFPASILICTGGVTGTNNPEQLTEAGVMKEYLTESCGIAEERILTEEIAQNTAENAWNVYEILRRYRIKSFTLITSSYHQQWAQVLYGVAGLLAERDTGEAAKIIGNFCFETEPEYYSYRFGERYAARQLAVMLGFTPEETELLPEIPYY
ncbi:MAG: YdcF family protein [Lachnospiraceae bacterium]|nr:YdcF family protein [Lachnospiraceae bacterium]